MRPQTWADVDRIAAARQAMRVECVERLAKVLAKEFDVDDCGSSTASTSTLSASRHTRSHATRQGGDTHGTKEERTGP
jgi:hypothetical protein